MTVHPLLLAAFVFFAMCAQGQEPVEAGRMRFETLCAGCHGADGMGGERAPRIGASERSRTEEALRNTIRDGIPDAGMPPFPLPDPQFEEIIAFVRSRTTPAIEANVSGDVNAGRDFFFGKGNCSSCHMAEGRGEVTGPDLTKVGRERTLGEIERTLRSPGPRASRGFESVTVRLRDGSEVKGLLRNESNYDLQVLRPDGRLHFLLRDQVAAIVRNEKSLMPAVKATDSELQNLVAYLSRLSDSQPRTAAQTSSTDRPEQYSEGHWPGYHGHPSGNRHSPLAQINRDNVRKLAPRWIFPIQGSERLEVTPVVVGGVMYVTAANEAFALDARTGREVWHYKRPRTKGLVGDAAGGINRGVAVRGDRVFMVTDNAHLLALHRLNGGLLWDVEMADSRAHYGATSAPLAVGDVVISGTSGGDEGIRGFVAAYRAATGERAWQFWTVPHPGEPLAKTWAGRAIEHGCAAAWLTGTYDAKADLVYWPVGNPCPDFNGDERKGDNLYSNTVLALEPRTGKLRWHYQFTPHDTHDWDATETPVLVDAILGGRPRTLLVQANRNGFFYVLDRLTGELLLAKPFVRKLNWASGIGKDGRPQLLPGTEPTVEGVTVCPSMDGATNWMSTAYNPQTGLFYVQALEKCNIYTKSSAWWQPGESFYGGATRPVPGEAPRKYLRAIDLRTGEIAWELPQPGPGNTWGGVLSTAGGLVFFGDDSGAFAAVDAATGKPLWNFHTNQVWKASPMTYMVDGRQFIGVAAGSNILAFAVSE